MRSATQSKTEVNAAEAIGRSSRALAGVAAAASIGLAVAFLRPADLAVEQAAQARAGQTAYLSALQGSFRKACSGVPCAAVDLDLLDANVAAVVSTIGTRRSLRLVVKSLPSLGLLGYLMDRAGTRRLMVFHAGHVEPLLEAFGKPLDLLFGKPMPAEAVEALLHRSPRAAASVQWLIDSEARLIEYLGIARRVGVRLNVSLEIDVGLRRGGFATPRALEGALLVIQANRGFLRLAGLMGYDGHVAHAPALFGPGKARASSRAFDSMLVKYEAFVRVLSGGTGLTLNGGGSRTFARYSGRDSLINDIALGSALLKPAHFDDSLSEELRPALWVGVPILKRSESPPLPFLEPFCGVLKSWDPNLARGYFLYGSVWDSPIAYPYGLRPGWFNDHPIHNLLPNQMLLTGSESTNPEPGDYVIFRPREGDGFAVFEKLVGLRGGVAEKLWTPLARLN